MSKSIDIDTANVLMPFGKFKGERITRVPIDYLQWAHIANVKQIIIIDNIEYEFWTIAKVEITRRGERIQICEVSGHAIDRLSQRFLDRWKRTRKSKQEGLYSWAQRIMLEALNFGDAKEENGKTTVSWLDMKLVIQTNTTLLTVK